MVFGLTQHFRGHDERAANIFDLGNRGDLLFVPGFSEQGDILGLCTWFDKGETGITLLSWTPPTNPDLSPHYDELYELLRTHETR